MQFENKIVMVTGGTSGLGEATVKAFVQAGAKAHFCGLVDAEGARVEAETTDFKGTATYHHKDVRSDADMAGFVADVVAMEGHLDIAVNNAAISHAAARFADQDIEMVRDVLDTNLMGVWHSMRHEIKAMTGSGGVIVNVASVLSEEGAEWMTAYGTSKHAVIGLTKSAALDYASDDIRIVAVSPGPMKTPMLDRALEDIDGDMSKYAGGFPDGGPMKPEAVAKTILSLASSDSSIPTGTNIIVDGTGTAG